MHQYLEKQKEYSQIACTLYLNNFTKHLPHSIYPMKTDMTGNDKNTVYLIGVKTSEFSGRHSSDDVTAWATGVTIL